MARKMNLPKELIISSQAEQEQISSDDITAFEKTINHLKNVISFKLRYVNKTDEEIIECLDGIHGRFEKMVRLFQEFGVSLRTCDEIMGKIDENKAPELYKRVFGLSVEIEKNYNALTSFFERLSREQKLKCLGIDSDIITISEIESWKNKIQEIPFFPQKEQQKLIQALDSLVEDFNDSYNKIMESSYLSLLIGDAIVIGIVYLISKLFAWILGEWIELVFLFFYGYTVIKKYEQLESIEKHRGAPESLKTLLAAIALTDGRNK